MSSTVNLDAEMAAALRQVRSEHLARLRGLGIIGEPFAQLGMRQPQFGVARIAPISGGFFEPDPDGAPAMIVPATEPRVYDGLIAPIERWEIIDLVAFRTARPSAWHWRTGNAWGLGEHLIAHDTGQSVEVVATPLDWLAMGGSGVCILDWSAESPAWRYLRNGPPLVIESDRLRSRLAEALARSIRLPTMGVRRAA